MIDIIGGVYHEHCIEGNWNEWFGSGLRAAVTIKQYDPNCRLHAYISANDEREVNLVAAGTYCINLLAHKRRTPISFYYDHGLSVPAIKPAFHQLQHEMPFTVTTENAVRFGVLEGDPIVHGKMVVYDPQSAFDPKPYRASGSTAERLAVICNRKEACLLTGTSDPHSAALQIASNDHAEVVVIKCGPEGALIFDGKAQVQSVSAFRTPSVWPIGSGDVFVAWFALEWILSRRSPIDSAFLASKAAALYCASPRSLDTLNPNLEDFPFKPNPAAAKSNLKYDVYLAGPFFDMGQRWVVEQAKNALEEMGLNVFSPFHNVGPGLANDVYAPDMDGLRNSKLIFAIVDGVDSGTLYETGFGAALNKPIVAFAKTTTSEQLKMLAGTPNCTICTEFVSAIYNAAWESRA